MAGTRSRVERIFDHQEFVPLIACEHVARIATRDVPTMPDDRHGVGLLLDGALTQLFEAIGHNFKDQRLERCVADGERLKVERIEAHHAAIRLGAKVGEGGGTQEHRRLAEKCAALANRKHRFRIPDDLRYDHLAAKHHVKGRLVAFLNEVVALAHVQVGRRNRPRPARRR